MGKPFSQEVNKITATFEWAYEQSVVQLERLVTRWSDGPLIVVGSGGSYSASSAWASFHRKALGTPSFASTPLQLSNYLNSLKDCRVLLLSAEGKNSDILNAARIAASLDIPCAALTLTLDNPLIQFAHQTKTLYSFNYEVAGGKDGYLATNSLLATVAIAAKVYFPKHHNSKLVSAEYLANRRQSLSITGVLNHPRENGLLVLHGPDSALFALDLESKLSESAIAKCEIADYRQFAHGRHLQLAESAYRIPLVIVAYTLIEQPLADAIIELLPSGIQTCRVLISGETLTDHSISSIVESLLITEAIGKSHRIDPGDPEVPDFGRKIYSLNSSAYQEPVCHLSIREVAVTRKIGGNIISNDEKILVSQAANTYLIKIEQMVIKALVCDFDGTLCHAHQRFEGINASCAEELIRLMDHGLPIGIATGRGGSVVENLRDVIPKAYWHRMWVGLYSGSIILRLDEEFDKPPAHPDLEDALQWLETTAFRHYAITNKDMGRAGQLSLRICDHRQATRLAASFAAWIYHTKRKDWRIFSSGHSVDLLHPTASKLNLVKHLAAQFNIDPYSEILKIGDAGQPGGNDFELLYQSFSLSADKVSESLTCCWNLAPSGVRQADAATFYLKHITASSEGIKIKFPV